jgi:hypothetical protein
MTGGGASLNFKVVPGLTQPGTAAENTIWVETEKIGTWYFSATQPEGMQEWDVWFQTGTSSTIEFNALKKDGIQVYPMSAKQYVSGALVDVAAMSYQGEKWVEWNRDISLIKDGIADERFVAIAKGLNANQAGAAPTVTQGDGYIRLYMKNYSDYRHGLYYIPEKIDLTDVTSIEVTVEETTGYGSYLQVHTEIGSYASKNVVASLGLDKGQNILDVSHLPDGEYIIAIRITCAMIGSSWKGTTTDISDLICVVG